MIKKAVNANIIGVLDNNNLNGVFPKNVSPSLENLLFWVWRQLTLVAHLKGIEEIELSDVPLQKYVLTRDDVVAYINSTSFTF
jgi:6-pyruvoyl-tetrahydropterin synthase